MGIRIEPREESASSRGKKITYYYGSLVIPRPDQAGEHGTAHFTIREYLRGFDEIWVAEQDVKY